MPNWLRLLHSREETYQEGNILLTEDAPADQLFLVEQGKVALEKKIQLGKRSKARAATIGYVDPGKVAGWSALVQPYLYAWAALCLEPTHVIALDGVRLREYLNSTLQSGSRFWGCSLR